MHTITRRIDLNVGTTCNLRCKFCYYSKGLSRPKDLSTAGCKALIRKHRLSGMETLEFTGGEPTVRADLFELVEFALKQGFKNVSMITNGLRLSEKQYARRLVECGVADFLLSLHGSTCLIHDGITGVSGSFDRLLEAVGNLSAMGVKPRLNSVVTSSNVSDVYERAVLARKIGIKTLNFIMFNPLDDADTRDPGNFVSYPEAAMELKRVIGDMGGYFEKLTIRYMPLCALPGYEKYIQNVQQVHFDHDEWNYYRHAYVKYGGIKWACGVVLGLLLLPDKRSWMKLGFYQAKHAAILTAHSWFNKRRMPACKGCSYGFICGGIWKKYAHKSGSDALKAVPGRLIIEPWHFIDHV